MSLHSLAYLLAPWVAAPGTTVTDLTLDSRRVTAGSLFLAMQGGRRHGSHYLREAIANGARALAWEPAEGIDGEWIEEECRRAGIPAVLVPSLSQRVSALAGRFFDEPSRELLCIGVTGTDGKTSVTQFLARMLDRPGARCAVMGTLGGGFPDELTSIQHTTPDAVELQRWLAWLRDAGARCVAMEVSSHALDQRRADAIDFDVAVLTQLARDHLDYHGDAAAYARAKARLFELRADAAAVLNLDDAFGRELAARLEARGRRVIGYSTGGARAAIGATRVTAKASGLALTLRYGERAGELELPLLGRFNAANVLAAAGASLAAGLEFDELIERLGLLRPVPGRMERFAAAGAPLAVVDYAHTPGALEAALSALREHCAGHLWVVFGCGGDRDRGKRALMGEVATRLADAVVLTSDNPRNEAPEAIIADIAAGCEAAPAATIADRHAAIGWALEHAGRDDVVLVAGKGHETHQIVGERRLVFSDRAVIRELMAEVV